MNALSFVRRYGPIWVLAALLAAGSLVLVSQISSRQHRHGDLREAFILLHTKGYQQEAQRLYDRLIEEVGQLSDRALLDDFQRTLTLVEPARQQPGNLIWRYHWTVSNELEKRSDHTLRRALSLAREN